MESNYLKEINKYKKMGLNLNLLGKYDLAIKYFKKVLKLDEYNFDALINMAAALIRLNKSDEALSLFHKAHKVKPKDEFTLSEIGNIMFSKGRYSDAIKSYEEVISINREHKSAYYNKALAYEKMKEYGNAIKGYAELIEVDKNYFDGYYSKARVEENIGLYKDAIDTYKNLAKVTEDDIQPYLKIAQVYNKIGFYKHALEYLDMVIAISTELSIGYLNKAVILHTCKEDEEAIKWFDKAIIVEDDNPDIYARKGISYNSLKEYEKALECYDLAIQIKNDFFKAYIFKGELLMNQKRYKEAAECYDLLLKKDKSKQYSSLARAPYNLAIAYKYLKDNENLKTACESGLEYYDQLIEMSEENPEFYALKGELYMFLGNIVEAEKAYDYALKLDSDCAEGYYLRAKFYLLNQNEKKL